MEAGSIELVAGLKKLVSEERRITAQVISRLELVQSRRIYAELGYSSLFDFCVRGLGYSESAAQRRILAMRITRDVPEVRTAIEAGTLSLSTASRVQQFAKQQGIEGAQAKGEILKAVVGKSSREVEKIFAAIAPKPIPAERQRQLTQTEVEIRFVADEELVELLARVREVWAHKNPNFSHAELTRAMAQFVLSKCDPMRMAPAKAASRLAKVASSEKVGNKVGKVGNVESVSVATANNPIAASASQPTKALHNPASDKQWSRYIPREVYLFVWRRDRGECRFRDPRTDGRCGSRFGLEVDHIKAFALGGSSVDPANLRLLCKAHNLFRVANRRH